MGRDGLSYYESGNLLYFLDYFDFEPDKNDTSMDELIKELKDRLNRGIILLLNKHK